MIQALKQRLIDQPTADWLFVYDNQLDANWGPVNVAGKDVPVSVVMKATNDERYLPLFGEWINSLAGNEVLALAEELEANKEEQDD